MNKRLLAFSIGIAGISLYLLYADTMAPLELTQRTITKVEPSPSFVLHEKNKESESGEENKQCQKADDEFAPTRPLHSSKASGPELDKLVEQGFLRPDLLVDRATKGEELASIGLFKLVQNCYPYLPLESTVSQKVNSLFTGCPVIPENLIRHPLRILEVAIEKGSSEAKLFYAMNAASLARFYLKQSTPRSLEAAQEINAKAEIYGHEAARDGLVEAYHFMSKAYENGEFSPRDYERAYKYSSIVASQSDQAKDRSVYLARFLSKDTRNERIAAEGCDVGKSAAIYRSPF